jgi:RNA polymerase primary sigma factor
MVTFTPPAGRPIEPTLGTYLNEIKDEPLLSAAEERELAERIAEGDSRARERLARSNLRLVVTIARKYNSRRMGLDDLIEEGNLGLLRAVESYDPTRGTRFSTYAAFWIKQSIRRGLLNSEPTIRLPAYAAQMMGEWRRETARLQSALGRAPADQEVADSLGWSARQLAVIRQAHKAQRADFQPFCEEDGPTLEETLKDENVAAPSDPLCEADLAAHVRGLVDRLGGREALILRLRFGLDGGPRQTLQEVGKRLGLTRARVNQIEKAALRKLREWLGDE